jgi:hypothetical protein
MRRTLSSSSDVSSQRFAVEPLERRQLLSAPHVISVISDNRGEVIITLDQAVVASTVNPRSAQLSTVGPDLKFGTADDVHIIAPVRWNAGSHRITIKGQNLPANTTYSIKLSAKIIKNGAGSAQLDTQNGGFTAFGVITNASGRAVMDSIGALSNKDLRTNGDQTPGTDPTFAMDDAPVLNTNATKDNLNPSADLVVIRRVAILNKLAAIVLG